jgi:acyl-CoA thioester hydrolase
MNESISTPQDLDDDRTTVRLAVRADDLDVNGHVRGAAYLAYADHARWVLLGRAGIDLADLTAQGLGPINLETTVRFHAELRAGVLIAITTRFDWTTGSAKTSRVHQELRRDDGVLVAEVSSVSGLLDLTTRRLLPRADRYWGELAARPQVLGVAASAGG